MNFTHTGLIHENARKIADEGLWMEYVDFPDLAIFDTARKAFAGAVGKAELHGLWIEMVDVLKIVHAKIARTPCRPSWLLQQKNFAHLHSQIIPQLQARLSSVDPSVQHSFCHVVETLTILGKLEASPVAICASRLLSTFKENSDDLFVLRDPKLWEEAKLQISRLNPAARFELRKPVELRQHPTVDNLIIFGPSWVLRVRNESFLLGSPLAASIWFIVCQHEQAGSIPSSFLDEDATYSINGDERPSVEIAQLLEHEPTYPRVSPNFILKKGQDSSLSWLEDFQEKVRVLPVILGGGKGIYFEEDAVVYSPTVEVAKDQRVCLSLDRKEVGELEPNMLVLLTTEGGGEMIPIVADTLLKHHASRIRELEHLWKQRLIAQVKSYGLPRVAELLGTSSANIRNWCNPRNIAPERLEEHLRPILQLVGLSERYDEIVHAVAKLRWAHQSAGMKLQAHLLNGLKGWDLREAYLSGFQDIQDKTGGPVKTVYLVREILAVDEKSSRLIRRVWDLEA